MNQTIKINLNFKFLYDEIVSKVTVAMTTNQNKSRTGSLKK